ncbi:hypothetical protein [Streptomyces sioyaensis]|uniref:hypothetical protein n=1 Tax=Streptomyces sioyaensis TaxID=67364 RepID=UPI0036E5B2F5
MEQKGCTVQPLHSDSADQQAGGQLNQGQEEYLNAAPEKAAFTKAQPEFLGKRCLRLAWSFCHRKAVRSKVYDEAVGRK